MYSLSNLKIFNSLENFAEGWYWVLTSPELKRKQAAAVKLLGRDLALYRSESGTVYALDAYCQHMGAHLGDGKVEGEHIRCLFHYWKYDSTGNCIDIPCQKIRPNVDKIRSWPVEERYGLIWVWTGDTPKFPLPEVPELEGKEICSAIGHSFEKKCHPNVIMINAIDEQHFYSVHALPVPLNMESEVIDLSTIRFTNTAPIEAGALLRWALKLLYKESITYKLSYWSGSTGCITIGPDFFHFYVLFALRPTEEGGAVGYAIPLTRKYKGIFGKLFNFVVLRLSMVVSNYFAHGDTTIFNSIKFNFKTPVKADLSIIRFIQHLEQQPTIRWGTWGSVDKSNEVSQVSNSFN